MIAELATRRETPPKPHLRAVSDAPIASEPQLIPKGPAAFILFGKHRETTLLPYHSPDPETQNKPKPIPDQIELFNAYDLKRGYFTNLLETRYLGSIEPPSPQGTLFTFRELNVIVLEHDFLGGAERTRLARKDHDKKLEHISSTKA